MIKPDKECKYKARTSREEYHAPTVALILRFTPDGQYASELLAPRGCEPEEALNILAAEIAGLRFEARQQTFKDVCKKAG